MSFKLTKRLIPKTFRFASDVAAGEYFIKDDRLYRMVHIPLAGGNRALRLDDGCDYHPNDFTGSVEVVTIIEIICERKDH